ITPQTQESVDASIGGGTHIKISPTSALVSSSTAAIPESRERRQRLPQPKMAINQPLALEGDREASAASAAAKTGAVAAAKGAIAAQPSGGAAERGRVVIRVPRSFYYNMKIRSDEREPSPEELQLMAERTEKQIRTVVALVLPGADSWKVDVDTIPDDVSIA